MNQKYFAALVLALITSISCTTSQPTRSCASVDACADAFAPKENKIQKLWALPTEEIQHPDLLAWSENKREQIKNLNHDKEQNPDAHFNEPEYLDLKARPIIKPEGAVKKRVLDTISLYKKKIGWNSIKSMLWTGIESGNPLTRHEEYRWNSLREQGMYDPAKRKEFVAQLQKLGIKNIRMGISNHEIDVDKEETWHELDAMLKDLKDGGLDVSLDMHHFGIEDRFRVTDKDGKTIHEKSYYLNSAWPDYFARFAAKAYSRYHDKIAAITIMNEPETVVGFNGEMLHGGFPGWSSPQSNFYYIERSLNVAAASVKARIAIEGVARKIYGKNARPLFMHTEATVHKQYWEDFNRFRRFLISDMILGHEWILESDLKDLATAPMYFDPKNPEKTKNAIVERWHRKADQDRTSFDWLIENYIGYNQAPENREAIRANLVKKMTHLRNLHLKLKAEFGKEMRTDTVFGIDYYAHNEDKDKDQVRLEPEPEHYGEQVKSGRRVGLYPVMVDYYNRYGMPLMVSETGTPWFYYGARWAQQMLIECSFAAKSGIPVLGLTIYPAIDTWGWESALSVPKDQALYNPSGIVDLAMKPRYFIGRLLQSLKEKMKP